jgi:hypothetical protein
MNVVYKIRSTRTGKFLRAGSNRFVFNKNGKVYVQHGDAVAQTRSYNKAQPYNYDEFGPVETVTFNLVEVDKVH